MSELNPSPFICAKCGKVAMWEKLEDEMDFSTRQGGIIEIKPTERWWLHMPCECGSQIFKAEADPKKFVGSYGTHG